MSKAEERSGMSMADMQVAWRAVLRLLVFLGPRVGEENAEGIPEEMRARIAEHALVLDGDRLRAVFMAICELVILQWEEQGLMA